MEDQTAMVVAPPPSRTPKKRGGSMSFLRAAMFIVRRSPNKKKTPAAVEVAANAMKLVGSMRPLHLQENDSPPPPPTLRVSLSVDNFLDVYPPPMSPSAASTSGSSTDGMNSRFASAQNLQDLDRPDNGDVWGDDGGDEMIDIKAKEFIAQFYEQIRLERLDSVKRDSQ